jgi:hypothetical protein
MALGTAPVPTADGVDEMKPVLDGPRRTGVLTNTRLPSARRARPSAADRRQLARATQRRANAAADARCQQPLGGA